MGDSANHIEKNSSWSLPHTIKNQFQVDCKSPCERLKAEKPLENNVGEYLYGHAVGKVLKHQQQ